MAVQAPARRGLLVSRVWLQAVGVVVLFGFLILGLLAYRTYLDEPPIPTRVVSTSGQVLFTGKEISRGQQVFLGNGLMEYGSVFGHGAYLGPDFTADYLHRAALSAQATYAGQGSANARQQVINDFQANRYDKGTGRLVYTDAQARAFTVLQGYYGRYFGDPKTDKGLRPHLITSARDVHDLTAFFSWSAWAASSHRPGKDYSYTNSWPPEALVGNGPTANVVVWSVLSLIALLAGIGALFAAFGRWGDRLGWRGRQAESISFRPPGEVAVTPAPRATRWFFLVVGLLFLVQTLVGAAAEHYRADITNFFGLDLARLLPYNLVRTWHVQLSIFWVAAAFLAAGIFLVPIIAGREPRGQHRLSYALLGALVVVVGGSLIGEFLGLHGYLSAVGSWFGVQGLEYLDLARFWQVLLIVGLFLWAFILYRGLRGLSLIHISEPTRRTPISYA